MSPWAFRSDLAAGLRTLAGMAPVCAACRRPARHKEVCARCIAQSTGGAGPWQPRTLAPETGTPALSVRYFARYECGATGRTPIAALLTSFKYGRHRDSGRSLAALVGRCPPPLQGRIDAVVPVPLAPGDLRKRGFNQAAWLSRAIAEAIRAPIAPAFLHRIADDGPQAGRDATQRRRRPSPFRAEGLPPAGPRILLIDDVCTTGTTLVQAAAALLCAGALHVDSAVLLSSDRRSSR